MKKKIIILIFLTAIVFVNVFTYDLIKKSRSVAETSSQTTNTTKNSSIDITVKTTASESHEPSDPVIETTEKIIVDDYVFIPYPVTDTMPLNHIRNVSNFGYLPTNNEISFGTGDEYTELEGIITFRGNNFRNMAAYGNITINEAKFEPVWSVDIGAIDNWTGVGWSGQPLIVKWPDELKQIMNIYSDKKAKTSLVEVIYATLDGKIYFLDLDDGSATRPPINAGVPHKGTPSLDPRGYPLLYVGQGINLVHEERVPLGFRIYSLIDQKMLYFLDGNDPDKRREWFAFDSSALIDAANDTLYEPGESGIFYKILLNTVFELENAKISILPEISKYIYDPMENNRPGIENSMVTYMNYGFFADNSGYVKCIDLKTLEPVWVNFLKEDTDASLVAEEINGRLYLYAGSQVDFQGTSGTAYVRKIDGLTGEFMWENGYICGSTEDVNGGVMATPVLGSGLLEDHIFFNIAKYNNTFNSLLVALDKNTGEEIWRYVHNNYAWASPVFVKSDNDKYYIIQCDSIGQVILFDAMTGEVVDVTFTGSNIEGSPVLYNDIMVIGTRGQKIWGIRIR